MPIVGATDKESLLRGRSPALAGRLWKGGPKREKVNKDGKKYSIFGEDLKWFRFESPDPQVVEAFQTAYGDKPDMLRVILPYPTAEENFPTWVEGNDNRGKIMYQSDGINTVARRIGSTWSTRASDQVPVSTLESQSKPRWVGRLYFIVPAVWEIEPKCILLKTFSKNDCVNISIALAQIERTLPRGQTLKGQEVVIFKSMERVKDPEGRVTMRPLVRLLSAAEYDNPQTRVVLVSDVIGEPEEDGEELEREDGTTIDPSTGEILPASVDTDGSLLLAAIPANSAELQKRAVEELGYKAWKHAQATMKKYHEGGFKGVEEMWAVLVEHAPILEAVAREEPVPGDEEEEPDTIDPDDADVPF